jgi:hypothetical protein
VQIIGGFWVYAGILEYLQHFSPGRHPAIEDFAASALGALCGGLAIPSSGGAYPYSRWCNRSGGSNTPSSRGTESSLTLRWRGLDSNFQYAGAVNLIVAPFADRLFRLLDAISRVDGASPGHPPFSHGHRQQASRRLPGGA